jgi:NAD dependent epimerase/dehydratase family enzyme
MATVLITGGTGLIGTALSAYLKEKGHSIMILSRKTSGMAKVEGIQRFPWNPKKNLIHAHAIEQADYIIHIASAEITYKLWTVKRRKENINRRKLTGQCIDQACKNPEQG